MTTLVWLLVISLNGEPYIPYPTRAFQKESECDTARKIIIQESPVKKVKARFKCKRVFVVRGQRDSA